MIERVKSQETPQRKPGRPRSEKARQAILKAAMELLDQGGPGMVTMEAVAIRARVGKPTIYRSWPNAQALAMAALMAQPAPKTDVPATGSAIDDLRRQLRKVVDTFATKRGRQISRMIAAAENDSEIAKAFRNQVILQSREEGRALLLRAASAGEITDDLDLEVALDLIYGPIFYRLLVGHRPLDHDLTDGLLAMFLEGAHP